MEMRRKDSTKTIGHSKLGPGNMSLTNVGPKWSRERSEKSCLVIRHTHGVPSCVASIPVRLLRKPDGLYHSDWENFIEGC